MGSSRNSSSITLNKQNNTLLNVVGNSDLNESSITLNESVEEEEEEEMGLPPTDGGRAAWTFMLGAVLVDAVIWGKLSQYWFGIQYLSAISISIELWRLPKLLRFAWTLPGQQLYFHDRDICNCSSAFP